MYSGLYTIEDIVNILLNVDYRVYIAHNGNLKDLLFTMDNNDEHEVMVRL